MINVVGNAKSIFDAAHGELIDSGKVIRFNWGGIVGREHQGSRTDIVITSEMNVHRVQDVYQHAIILPTERVPYVEFSMNAVRDCEFASTGFITLYWLNKTKARNVNLFGFNWDTVEAYYKDDWIKHVHNYQEEKKFIQQWVEDNHWNLY